MGWSKMDKRRQKGVSLVELILSIAILAFVGVYVIQMFLLSQQLNRQAKDLDQGVLISTQLFELVEQDQSLASLKNAQIMKFAKTTSVDDGVKMDVYFDDEWGVIPDPLSTGYVLAFETQKVQTLTNISNFYKVTIERHEDDEVEQVYEIEMQKYE